MASTISKQVKERAVLLYLLDGNATRVAKQLGVDEGSIRNWRKTEWWEKRAAQISAEIEAQHKAMWAKVLDKARDKILERIEKGDEVIGKNGEIKYRAVSAAQLATVAGIAFDKYQIASGKPTSISSKSKSLEDRAKELEKLSEDYAKRNAKREGKLAELKRA